MNRDKLLSFIYRICEVKMVYGVTYVGWLLPYRYNKKLFEMLTLDADWHSFSAKDVEDIQLVKSVKYEYEVEEDE